MAAALVAVGEILRPYGLTGEVRVKPLTDRPRERFGRLRECVLWEPAGDRRQACRLASCRVEGETVLVRVEGIESPEAARSLRGWLLAVDRAQALEPTEGRFYPWQLEGAEVRTRDGRVVGRWVGVELGAGQDLWVVDDGGTERLIPAVPEIVVEVNVAEKRVVIDPPEGLLEL
ncbi:MAG TPA: ribosome maturation factor RimM [Methylomirabilota bacterium]|nr:ribosome maturation factor RimM [Methylomirabilota bacterium]